MKAAEMIKKVITMLGYTDGSGSITESPQMKLKAMSALNAVYADLFYALGANGTYAPIATSESVVELPERIINDVMPYGVAAMLAQSENDGDSQQYYIMLYNSKRAAINRSETVEDKIPNPE